MRKRIPRNTVRRSLVVGVFSVGALCHVGTAVACTGVILRQGSEVILGHNYDFAYAHGAIFVNGAGVMKTSLHSASELGVTWVSKYSSVVFSQFGQELPTSGMNEAGLAVVLLWNEDGSFPVVDPTKIAALNELQWIQYHLDVASSVSEVLQAVETRPIAKSFQELHYVLCDASGQCALVEFTKGSPVVYSGQRFTGGVITNNSLANSRRHFERYRGEDYDALPSSRTSLGTYVRAAWITERTNASLSRGGKLSSGDAFGILGSVGAKRSIWDLLGSVFGRQPSSVTAWSTVFSPRKGWIEFRTEANAEVRRLNVAEVRHSCSSPTLALNVDGGRADIAKYLRPNSGAENERIVRASYAPIEDTFPRSVQNALLKYPGSFRCVAP